MNLKITLKRIIMKKLIFAIVVASFLFACEKEVMDSDQEMQLKSSKGKLDLKFMGLSPLGPDYRYEGWIIVDGVPVSTGKFNITPSGVMAPSVFNVKKDDLENATTFALTIEPQPDPGLAPSDVHILAGDFSNGMADLTVSHSAALGTDFASAMGKYILATPTDGPNTNENSGIWFLDLSSGGPMVGLDLPVLPAGWVYEGWTVIDGVPVSSGKFMDVDMVDMDDPYSSMENPGPPFPGEDYLMNAPGGLMFPTDISGGVAVISVEPYPDNSDEPFAIKPLVGMIPGDATDHTTYMMGLNSGSFPTGMATK